MAKFVAALPDMQIAVTDSGRIHPDQDLTSHRSRRRPLHFLQGRVEIGNLKAPHGLSPAVLFYCVAVKPVTLSLYLYQGVMASGVLAGRDRAELRNFVATLLIGARPAGAEPAPRGWGDRR